MSSIEYLAKELNSLSFDYVLGQVSNKEYDKRYNRIIEHAKANHKREIEDAYWEGGQDVPTNPNTCNDYYTQTFNK